MNLTDRRKNLVMRGYVKLAIRLGFMFGSAASAEYMEARLVPQHVMQRVLTSFA
jgi:hypothetical protein